MATTKRKIEIYEKYAMTTGKYSSKNREKKNIDDGKQTNNKNLFHSSDRFNPLFHSLLILFIVFCVMLAIVNNCEHELPIQRMHSGHNDEERNEKSHRRCRINIYAASFFLLIFLLLLFLSSVFFFSLLFVIWCFCRSFLWTCTRKLSFCFDNVNVAIVRQVFVFPHCRCRFIRRLLP